MVIKLLYKKIELHTFFFQTQAATTQAALPAPTAVAPSSTPYAAPAAPQASNSTATAHQWNQSTTLAPTAAAPAAAAAAYNPYAGYPNMQPATAWPAASMQPQAYPFGAGVQQMYGAYQTPQMPGATGKVTFQNF